MNFRENDFYAPIRAGRKGGFQIPKHSTNRIQTNFKEMILNV